MKRLPIINIRDLKKNLYLVVIVLLINAITLSAQDYTGSIEQREAKYVQLEAQLETLTLEIDSFNLLRDLDKIKEIGLPSDSYLDYAGYYLEYSEEHEQALWTMHIINPRISNMGLDRTNDFRVDDRITTGTAEEIDYFVFDTIRNEYDGYGYDRGHLVPSADFRFNKRAMSDTYYYSNISPQIHEFNGEIWAELEAFGRNFVKKYKRSLAVVTIPIFDKKNKISRSVNKVTIPSRFAKALLDTETNQAIGFLLAHTETDASLQSFAVTIDEIEEISGYDFFSKVVAEESTFQKEFWFDVIHNPINPIAQTSLPKNHYNTKAGAKLVGNDKEVWVCGKCVGGANTRTGSVFLNLDKAYPNSPISGFISKESIGHFQSSPLDFYRNKDICIKGAVKKWDAGSNPRINIKNSHYIKLYEN